MIKIIDDFLGDFEWFRQYADGLHYVGTVNPVDGVEYPGINTQIPPGIAADVVTKLGDAVLGRPSRVTMFLRMTLDGDDVPHQAHTDDTMGQYGMVLYLNRPEDCKGGTSFVQHSETGMDSTPKNTKEGEIWKRDTNTPDAWQITDEVGMQPNRALIFDTDMMHRPEPPAGFGDTVGRGRLVMVCFFDVF